VPFRAGITDSVFYVSHQDYIYIDDVRNVDGVGGKEHVKDVGDVEDARHVDEVKT
jgi:hypothetical protein